MTIDDLRNMISSWEGLGECYKKTKSKNYSNALFHRFMYRAENEEGRRPIQIGVWTDEEEKNVIAVKRGMEIVFRNEALARKHKRPYL